MNEDILMLCRLNIEEDRVLNGFGPEKEASLEYLKRKKKALMGRIENDLDKPEPPGNIVA